MLPNPVETGWQVLVAIGVGLACLALLALVRRRPVMPAPVDDHVRVPVA
jgi:hypothetical protein